MPSGSRRSSSGKRSRVPGMARSGREDDGLRLASDEVGGRRLVGLHDLGRSPQPLDQLDEVVREAVVVIDDEDHGAVPGRWADHPSEGNGSLVRLDLVFRLRGPDIEPGGPEQGVGPLGRQAREVHVGDAQPPSLDVAGVVRDPERGAEPTAGPQPPVDPREQLAGPGCRDVSEHVEGDDGIEGLRRQFDVEEVSMQQGPGRNRQRAWASCTSERSTPVYRRPSASARASVPGPHPSSRMSAPDGMSRRMSARNVARGPSRICETPFAIGPVEEVVAPFDHAARLIDLDHGSTPIAGSNAAALAFVSASSVSGSESATTPAPVCTCARPSDTTAVRIVMQKSRSPANVR